MRIMRRKLSFVMFLGVILLLAFVSVSSFAAEYPKEKVIRLVVPYGAGGGTDINSRILASSAQVLVDQRIDIICMPGAAGQDAVNFVMDQPKDGYTFLVTDFSTIIAAPLTEKVDYEPSDWKPVIKISGSPNVFFVKEDSSIKDVNDWVAKAKANPNVFSVAHGRYLGSPHLPLIMFEKSAGIKDKHVPTTGGSECLAFVLGGHVDIGISLPSTIASSLRGGLVRAIAVSVEERFPLLPDVPTFIELGYDVVWPPWTMILAHKDVPEDRIEFIENKFIEALNTNGAQRMATKLNVILTPTGSEKCQEIYNETVKKFKNILAGLEGK